MRRKNRKIAKIEKASSISTESDSVQALCIDTEHVDDSQSGLTDQINELDHIDNNSNSTPTDISVQTEASSSSKPNDPDESPSQIDNSKAESSFLCVQLKLISIDQKCVDYKKISKKYLCLSSAALVEHIKMFLFNKMIISKELFEVIIILLFSIYGGDCVQF